MTPFFEARGLTRAVHTAAGPRLILTRVNIALAAGDLVSLSGPSGAGKTTLLRLLVGLDPLEEGELRIDGARLGDRDGSRLRTALCYVAQAPRVAAPSASAYLEEPARFEANRRRRPRPSERARLLAKFDLTSEVLDGSAAGLSGGERKRIAVARGLLYHPRGLLLDEPFAGLDDSRAEVVADEIVRFVSAGGAVVVAGHTNAPVSMPAPSQRWCVEESAVAVERSTTAEGGPS